MKKILFLVGGRSGEHEISLISGKHVLRALDRTRFDPIVVVIQKSGAMTYIEPELLNQIPDNPKQVKTPAGHPLTLKPFRADGKNAALLVNNTWHEFEVVFPILHGPGGEDGTIQGLFEFAQVPVVGCDTKSSAVCMDKAWTKKLCGLSQIPIVPYVEVFKGEAIPTRLPWDYPVFVKPANLGSSLGVTKVKRQEDLQKACESALSMDSKALIEQGISGREIEVAVFGKRGDLKVSPAGEIRPRHEFYTYEAKYVDEQGAELIFPASLTSKQSDEVRTLAKEIFNCLDCSGMARIDFFLSQDGQFYLNEVNTIPGFTPISMYPKLMTLEGMSYQQLITGLIDLAVAAWAA